MIHRFHSESICSSDVHCCQQTCQVVCSTLLTDHLTRYHPQTVTYRSEGMEYGTLTLLYPCFSPKATISNLNIHFSTRPSKSLQILTVGMVIIPENITATAAFFKLMEGKHYMEQGEIA